MGNSQPSQSSTDQPSQEDLALFSQYKRINGIMVKVDPSPQPTLKSNGASTQSNNGQMNSPSSLIQGKGLA